MTETTKPSQTVADLARLQEYLNRARQRAIDEDRWPVKVGGQSFSPEQLEWVLMVLPDAIRLQTEADVMWSRQKTSLESMIAELVAIDKRLESFASRSVGETSSSTVPDPRVRKDLDRVTAIEAELAGIQVVKFPEPFDIKAAAGP